MLEKLGFGERVVSSPIVLPRPRQHSETPEPHTRRCEANSQEDCLSADALLPQPESSRNEIERTATPTVNNM
jgi:hypothetical protein